MYNSKKITMVFYSPKPIPIPLGLKRYFIFIFLFTSNFIYFLIGENCFTILGWFLPYNNANHIYKYEGDGNPLH